MRKWILLALFLLTTPCFADETTALVARAGGASVRITFTPCVNAAVLGRLNQDTREDYRAATAEIDGAKFDACWRPMGGAVHLMYEDGDQGLVPMTSFKPVPTT